MEQQDWKEYADIIEMEHPELQGHVRMSLQARAAQFSPFAALSGYDEIIAETSRLTTERRILQEDAREFLDRQLEYLALQIEEQPQITVTFFVKDQRKDGGEYCRMSGKLMKIDGLKREIALDQDRRIPVDQIIRIEGENCMMDEFCLVFDEETDVQ